MNKAKLRRPPTAVLIAIIAVVVLVGTTVAWLTYGEAITTRVYSLSNFDAYAEVYFDGAVNPPDFHQNADGSINVDLTNDTAENYIGKLRVDAYYKGRGSAYVRLKAIQQWQDSGGKILQADASIPYGIATPYLSTDTGNQAKWYDNRVDDFCFYYATPLKANNNTFTAIPIITSGFDSVRMAAISPTGAGTTLKVAFTFEAVQVNRYPQFWGMQRLPWVSPPVVTTTAEETTAE
jgi:hypothetical protein